MGLLSVFKLAFSSTPSWIDRVLRTGAVATAHVIGDPRAILGKYSYSGRDAWVEVLVAVNATPQIETAMACRISQLFALTQGALVNVRYEVDDPRHTVLIDDPQALLQARARST